jgi:hypothetical protein
VTLDEGVSEYVVSASIVSGANLKSVKVSRKVGAVTNQVGSPITSFPNKNSYDLTQPVTGITADCSIIITVDNGVETSRELMIEYTPAKPVGDIKTFADVKMGSLAHSGTDDSFCASIDGSTYNVSAGAKNAKDNAAKIDFVYVNGSSAPHALYAPSNTSVQTVSAGTAQWSSWAVKNATKFKKLTGVNFEAVENDAIITELLPDANGMTDVVNSVAVNDVYGFITAGTSANPDKKGFLKIVSITGNNIVIAIKVQE